MGDLYVDHEYWITFVQLAMAMFAMGATLHVHDFRAVVRLPRSFLTGLVAQMVVVPVVTYVVLRAIDLDLDVLRVPSGRVWVDDEDEFAEHRLSFGYPPELVTPARRWFGRQAMGMADRR